MEVDTSLEPGVFRARVGKACTDLSPVPRFKAEEKLPRDVVDGSWLGLHAGVLDRFFRGFTL